MPSLAADQAAGLDGTTSFQAQREGLR